MEELSSGGAEAEGGLARMAKRSKAPLETSLGMLISTRFETAKKKHVLNAVLAIHALHSRVLATRFENERSPQLGVLSSLSHADRALALRAPCKK